MIHLYCGDGKGKTTCAMGLALRAAGRGWPVAIAQFLKSSDSGERSALALLPRVTLLPVPDRVTFTFAMDERQKKEAAARCLALLEESRRLLLEGKCRLLILDEVCAALTSGLLPLEPVLDLLDRCPEDAEVVLTGRRPHPELERRADYLTEMTCRRHPYQNGVSARPGVEF